MSIAVASSLFPTDMTETEHAFMQEHVAYWTGLAKAGKALVFGPVLDPRGPWGLGVVEADTPDEVETMRALDPAVKGGLHMEVFPMARAITGRRVSNP